MRRRVLGLGREVEFDRDAFEEDAVEDALEPGRRKVRAVTVSADASRSDEHRAGGAAFEIVEQQAVGDGGIRMIDPRHDLPGCGRRSRPASGVASDRRG